MSFKTTETANEESRIGAFVHHSAEVRSEGARDQSHLASKLLCNHGTLPLKDFFTAQSVTGAVENAALSGWISKAVTMIGLRGETDLRKPKCFASVSAKDDARTFYGSGVCGV